MSLTASHIPEKRQKRVPFVSFEGTRKFVKFVSFKEE